MLDDKYGHLGDNIPESKENESENKGKDKATVKREEFLNIYKEDKNAGKDGEEAGPDLSNGIRFRRDEEDESGFTLKTTPDSGQGKPLIQELDAVETTTSASTASK